MAAAFALPCWMAIALSLQTANAAPLRTYTFANDPAFTLLETGETFARFRFAPPERPAGQKNLPAAGYQAFIAVPMHGDVDIRVDSWKLLGTDGAKTYAGNIDDVSPEAREEVWPAVKSLFQSSGPERDLLGFHDMRVLHLEMNSRGRITQPIASTPVTCQVKKLDVTVSWPAPRPRPDDWKASGLTDAFDTLFQHVVLNNEQGQTLRGRPDVEGAEPAWTDAAWLKAVGHQSEGPLLHGADDAPAARANAIRILTERTGLYRFSGHEMQRDGFDLTQVDPAHISLWRDGSRIPFRVYGAEDGRIGLEDQIVFYSKATDNIYSRYISTWLCWDPEITDGEGGKAAHPPSDLPMDGELLASVPYRMLYEEDKRLAKDRSGAYPWVWMRNDGGKWSAGHDEPSTDIMPISWPGRTEDSSVTIRASIWNRLVKPAVVSLEMGSQRSEQKIKPRNDVPLELELSSAALASPTGVVLALDEATTIAASEPIPPEEKPGNEKRLFLDWITLSYERSLDVAHGPFRFQIPKELDAALINISGAEPDDEVVLWEITAEGAIIDWSDVLKRSEDGQLETFLMPEDASSHFELAKLTDISHTEQSWRDHASTLLREENQADIIFIAYNTLVDESRRLMKHRQANGWSAVLVDVQDIYDEFNGGMPDLDAIRTFLRYTLTNWRTPAPQFVILAGDASWDHRDNEGWYTIDQIPIYAPPSDLQDIATDEWLVELWGSKGVKQLPDMLTGRIAVREPEELRAYTDKVLKYENEPEFGWWRTRNLYIADDTFERDSREVTEKSTPLYLEPTYVNQVEYPYQTNPYLIHAYKMEAKFSPACTEAIVGAFNEGAAILQYFGHGGAQLWSHERIFLGTDRSVSDVLLLDETRRWPFIANWSCLTGLLNFNMPPFNVCLAEELIRHPNRGGIAAWAPNEYGSTDQHKIIAHHMMKAFEMDESRRLGTVTQIARVDYCFIRKNRKLMDQYVLFGDPMLKLAIPRERIELRCEPDEFPLHPDPEKASPLRITVTGSADGITSGKVSLRVYDQDQTRLLETPEAALDSQGRFEFDITLPPLHPDTTQIIVRAYAYDREAGIDTSGGLSIHTGLPDLTVEELAAEVSESDPGQLHITAAVQNLGSVTCPETSVTATSDDGTAMARTVGELVPGASVTVTWNVPRPDEPAYIVVKADADEIVGEREEEKNTASVLLTPDPDQVTGVAIASSLKSWVIDPNPLVAGERVRIGIPVQSLIESASVSAVAKLVAGGRELATQTVSLDPGRNRRLSWEWTPADPGGAELSLHLISDNPRQERVQRMDVYVHDKPDIYLVENSLETVPRFPTVGVTSYVTFQVGSRGEVPIRSVRLAATYRDKDSKNETQIKSFRNRSFINPELIRDLMPGEIRDVTLQWDDPGLPPTGTRSVKVSVDKPDNIRETDETNNEASIDVYFQDVPDLVVDLWNDHRYQERPRFHPWGDPIRLWGRVRNTGGASAERVRLSFLVDRDEHPVFFPVIESRHTQETSVAIPIYRGYNLFALETDRFDMISEKNEEAYRTGRKGNNLSKSIALDLTLIMPPGRKTDAGIVHEVREESYFAAGIGPMVHARRNGGITCLADLRAISTVIQPENVRDPGTWSLQRKPGKWLHDSLFSCFRPSVTDTVTPDIPFEVYAPNGSYDLALTVFGFAEDASAEVKLQGMEEYQLFTVTSHYAERQNVPIGPVEITDGRLTFSVRQSEPGGDLGLYGLTLSSRDEEADHWATYDSALFPIPTGKPQQVEITWDGRNFAGSALRLQGRFWDGTASEPKPGTWSDAIAAESGKLVLDGQGGFVQFRTEFVQEDARARPSILQEVIIKASG